MFSSLTKKEVQIFFLVFLPIYMALHLMFFPYFQQLHQTGYIKFNSIILANLYSKFSLIGFYIYFFSGLLFWIKSKVLLPIHLVSYWLVQAPNMNILNWHDQHVGYLTILTITLCYFSFNKGNLPVRKLIILYLAMFFYGAGLGKIHNGGWQWLDGETTRYRFLQYYLLFDATPGLWIANNFWLCKILTWCTVFFEISFPICLFWEKSQKFYVWGSLIFLTLIYITMKINFFWFLAPVYLVFLPWDKLANKMKLT
jgi:hypothetical protein